MFDDATPGLIPHSPCWMRTPQTKASRGIAKNQFTDLGLQIILGRTKMSGLSRLSIDLFRKEGSNDSQRYF